LEGSGLMIFELLLGPRYRGRLIFQYVPFLLLILGGGFYALANVQYYILVTMRQQKRIFLGYLAAAVVAFPHDRRYRPGVWTFWSGGVLSSAHAAIVSAVYNSPYSMRRKGKKR
jgi:hypothetical protein